MSQLLSSWRGNHFDRGLLPISFVFACFTLALPLPLDAQNFLSRVKPDPTVTGGKLKIPPKTDNTRKGLKGRRQKGRVESLQASGGSAESESAVEAALRWLADHQNEDGSWSFRHTPGDGCSRFQNPGTVSGKVGATGLALLPFLAASYTHLGQPDKYQMTVKRGLNYLVKQIGNDGKLSDASTHYTMYCHGIAACALAEAYGMTLDKRLKLPSQGAINFILAAQDPARGGWRYAPRIDSDTSVVGWQIMALKSALLAELKVNPNVGIGATKWLNSVQYDFAGQDIGIGSKYGYKAASGGTGATIAIGLLCRIYLGTSQLDPGLQKGLRYLEAEGPDPKNMYYNYYATMFMYQCDGPTGAFWKSWNLRMRDQLIQTQQRQGPDAGSWYFNDSHGRSGGRLYDTALSALTLEIYYRYLSMYSEEK